MDHMVFRGSGAQGSVIDNSVQKTERSTINFHMYKYWLLCDSWCDLFIIHSMNCMIAY